MNFDLTDEQRLLEDSIERFVTERYDFHAREKYQREADGFSRAIWAEMAELGLLALPFSEEDGGFGAGGVETMLVMQALGRGLVVEPYLSTVVICGNILRLAANKAQRCARLPGIIAGEHLMSLAHNEPKGPHHTLTRLMTRANEDGNEFVLNGRKTAVLHGGTASELIVSARSGSCISLFVVDPNAAGISIQTRPSYDGQRVADIVLHNVHVGKHAVLGEQNDGVSVLRATFEIATAALCAEAVGAMVATHETTVEYLKTRKQFGVAIGSFQALQHRAVDMLIQLELARSMSMLSALSLTLEDHEQRARNIAAAKIQIGRSGRFIGQQAVQLHGAIGITAEYKVGHAFKRLTAIDALLGDSNHHLDALAEAGGLNARHASILSRTN